MTVQKWNHKKQEYEPHEIPEGWNIVLYANDMDRLGSCAQCGKKLPFGDMYTSREVHTHMGFGYGVCSECYDQEWERERSAKVRSMSTVD